MEGKNQGRINDNLVGAGIFFLLGVFMVVYALTNHYGTPGLIWILSPYLFPILIGILIVFLSFSLLADGLKQRRAEQAEKHTTEQGLPVLWTRVLIAVVLAAGYFFLLEPLTFIPATVLFLVSMFLFLGERRIWLIALLSLATTLAIYYIFGMLLHVMLP